jgi:hypothetical protein
MNILIFIIILIIIFLMYQNFIEKFEPETSDFILKYKGQNPISSDLLGKYDIFVVEFQDCKFILVPLKNLNMLKLIKIYIDGAIEIDTQQVHDNFIKEIISEKLDFSMKRK